MYRDEYEPKGPGMGRVVRWVVYGVLVIIVGGILLSFLR